MKEAFLLEASGHVCARDVLSGGRTLLPAGSVVDSRTIAFLASAGIDRVTVFEEPKVSVLAIGNGLMAPGSPLKPGKAYDSCIPVLQSALEDMRLRPVFMRRLANEPKLLRRLLPFGLNQSDLMILMVKETWEGKTELFSHLEGAGAQLICPDDAEGETPPRFAGGGEGKLVFCLPYDVELILKYFHSHIQPAIQFFMGHKGFAAI